MNEITTHPKLDLEYEQINENFRFLADVRFKLLALVPTFGGAAVFILAHVGLEAGKAPSSSPPELLVVLLVSLFGFLATLGITLYDQRNSELYNALIHRARYLERQFGVPSTPGALRKLPFGGQFSERPKKARRVIFEAGHDLGLSLIYGALLGGWLFPILYAAARLSEIKNECAQVGSVVLAAIAAAGFVSWLVALDVQDRQLYNQAADRDGLKDRGVEMSGITKAQALEIFKKYELENLNRRLSGLTITAITDKPDWVTPYLPSKDDDYWYCCPESDGSKIGSIRVVCISKSTGEIVFDQKYGE